MGRYRRDLGGVSLLIYKLLINETAIMSVAFLQLMTLTTAKFCYLVQFFQKNTKNPLLTVHNEKKLTNEMKIV